MRNHLSQWPALARGLLLTLMPWAQRVWALPCMTGLYPYDRFYEQQGCRLQTMMEQAWQMIRSPEVMGQLFAVEATSFPSATVQG